MTELRQITTEIEIELLSYIIASLETDRIRGEEAEELAKKYLSSLPANGIADLLSTLYVLGQTYREALYVFVKYGKPYEEERRVVKLEAVSRLIKEGKFAEAVEAGKAPSFAIAI